MRTVRPISFQFLEQFNRQVVIGHVDFTAAIAVNISNFRNRQGNERIIDNGFSLSQYFGLRVSSIFSLTTQSFRCMRRC